MSTNTPEVPYKRLVELLGKRVSKDDVPQLIAELSSELLDEPVIFNGRTSIAYDFDQSGIHLDYDNEFCSLLSLSLCVFTAMIEAGDARPYAGDLPFGITAGDSREEVERKLATAAISESERDRLVVWEAPLEFEFRFRDYGTDLVVPRLSMVSAFFNPKKALTPNRTSLSD